MNQILATENKSKKKGGSPLEIKTVLIIFAICIMLFGAFFIGKAIFSMLNNNEEISIKDPLINTAIIENKLNIIVKHDKIIDKIVYTLNQEQEEVLQGKGRKELEEIVELPVGTNILSLKVIDINGKVTNYSEEITIENTDLIKPEIELLVENSKVKIVVKDETELDYIIYYWNQEDETRINVREESPKQIEEKIDILKGENTLTIIAVDKAGNEEKKEQTYKGASKPKIDITMEGNEVVVKVTDEEEIKKIEITLNGVFYSTDPEGTNQSLGIKEAESRLPLISGENNIQVIAYNISNLQTEKNAQATY